MAILVTGGVGYIGPHTVTELLENNKDVIMVDSLCNNNPIVLDRIEQRTEKGIKFYNIDLIYKIKLEQVFTNNRIESVIHFAALKEVGESVQKPL